MPDSTTPKRKKLNLDKLKKQADKINRLEDSTTSDIRKILLELCQHAASEAGNPNLVFTEADYRTARNKLKALLDQSKLELLERLEDKSRNACPLKGPRQTKAFKAVPMSAIQAEKDKINAGN